MADQPHEDESQDNVGTGAEISTENDVPAKFYDGPDGAPLSATAVALESPSAAHDRRSSTLFPLTPSPLRDDNPLNAAVESRNYYYYLLIYYDHLPLPLHYLTS